MFCGVLRSYQAPAVTMDLSTGKVRHVRGEVLQVLVGIRAEQTQESMVWDRNGNIHDIRENGKKMRMLVVVLSYMLPYRIK